MSALATGACFAAPDGAGPDTPLVLFFHGMYPPESPQAEKKLEGMLARSALERGFAILAPRGRRGLCDWSDEVRGWRCWPSHERQKVVAGEIFSDLGQDIREAAASLYASRVLPFVMGYSNGGFFAAFFAVESRWPARGYAILNAGALEPARIDSTRAAPILLVAGRQDANHGRMVRLREQLTAAGWAPSWREREGGHALTIEDARAVFDFFTSLDANVR